MDWQRASRQKNAAQLLLDAVIDGHDIAQQPDIGQREVLGEDLLDVGGLPRSRIRIGEVVVSVGAALVGVVDELELVSDGEASGQ